MKNGSPGEIGINLLKKVDGRIVPLGHREVLNVESEDSIIIETPGGGGYGYLETS